jgi:DNA-binding transcriptional LysR family regulator
MELQQLKCFLAAAEQLHFGRAAQRLHMLPSAFGRHVRLLEEDLGTRLFVRTTRAVALTEEGTRLLREAKAILSRVEAVETSFRNQSRLVASRTLRVGAIDSAAAGLLPELLSDFRDAYPEIPVHLVEEKTVRLLPKLLSGALDLAFVRPPGVADGRLEFQPLLTETAVVALPRRHALAKRKSLSLRAIAEEPMIVPDRRSRPHSHDLTIKLFEEAGLTPRVIQVADEKQTIVSMVAARLGFAIVPRWTSRMNIAGVRFVPLRLEQTRAAGRLPLAAAWVRDSRDPLREAMLAVLKRRLAAYAKGA